MNMYIHNNYFLFLYRCKIYIFRFFKKKKIFVLRNFFENLIFHDILKFKTKTCFSDEKLYKFAQKGRIEIIKNEFQKV